MLENASFLLSQHYRCFEIFYARISEKHTPSSLEIGLGFGFFDAGREFS